MNRTTKIITGIVILILYLVSMISLASAVTVSDVSVGRSFPGETTSVAISVKNTLSDDVEDVSVVLNLDNTRFTSVGGSEDSVDELREDREKSFNFRIKSANDLAPGDYNLPYTITYTFNDEKKEKKGSFGVTIDAETELSYSIEAENNVIGKTGKISIKIVNSGLGDIRFVSVKIAPNNGFTLLSEENVYIGEISSDDFETATFDVVFKNTNANIDAIVIFKDF
ncbi:MAG: hypothetical protein AABY22_05225, partial [Nanoarchaeota archaeon]